MGFHHLLPSPHLPTLYLSKCTSLSNFKASLTGMVFDTRSTSVGESFFRFTKIYNEQRNRYDDTLRYCYKSFLWSQ